MEEKFKIQIVNSKHAIKEFLNMPAELYKDDPNYIRPLDEDIEKIFDPKQNKKFRQGDAIRWVLKDSDNKAVGRIAAFYESVKPKKNQPLTGGCGFFDCIENQEAANLLFNAARDWLKSKKFEAMDGPVNFGSREMFWGCLSDGFFEPNYNVPYNKPYYSTLFTNYGFQNYFNQFTFHMPIDLGLMDPVIKENADRCKKDPKFNFTIVDKRKVDKYAQDFTTIFNEGWAKFPEVRPITLKQAKAMFKALKPVIDPRTVIFAYYGERPIGFFIMIPNLYQSYKKFNGKFGIINKIRLMIDLKIRKRFTKLIGQIFGIVPDFQKKGVSGGMIMHFAQFTHQPGFHYTDLEMNWIGDFNPGMIKMVKLLGAKVKKTHITYRYLFDRDAPFSRAKKVS